MALQNLPDSVRRIVVGVLIILGALGWFVAAWFAR